jgi:hypothetical protein
MSEAVTRFTPVVNLPLYPLGLERPIPSLQFGVWRTDKLSVADHDRGR